MRKVHALLILPLNEMQQDLAPVLLTPGSSTTQAGLAGVLGLAGSENVQVRPACMQMAYMRLSFATLIG